MKKKILKGGSGLLFVLTAKSSGAVFSVLITYIVMNFYSQDAAKFFFIFSAVNITSYICRFGSDNFLLRADPKNIFFKSELSSLYFLSLVASLVLGGIVLAASNFYLASIFFIANLFFTLNQISARYYAVNMRGVTSAFVMNSASLAVLVILTVLDIYIFKINFQYSFLWAWCVAVIFVSLISLPFRKLELFETRHALNVLNGSKIFFFSGVLNLTIYWGGQVISGFALTEEELKALAFSQRTSGIMGLLSLASSIYMSPRVARSFQLGDFDALEAIFRLCNLFVVSTVLCALLLSFMFYENILAIFNVIDNYAWLFLFTVTAQSIFCVLSNSLQLLNMTNNELLTRKSVFFGFLVFSTLSIIAYNIESVFVMAMAVNLSLIVQGAIAAYYVRKSLGLSPLLFILK